MTSSSNTSGSVSPTSSTVSTSSSDGACGHPVWLHVYDVGPVSSYLINSWSKRLACFGVFHAGVEVLGEEYTFQAMLSHLDEQGKPRTGVVRHEPKQKSAHIYRESISLGRTHLSTEDVTRRIMILARDWPSSTYNVLRRNCVHFSEQLAKDLQTTEPFPSWVNDLARKITANEPGLSSPLACCQSCASAARDKAEEFKVEDGVVEIANPILHTSALRRNAGNPASNADPEIFIGDIRAEKPLGENESSSGLMDMKKKQESSRGLLDMRKARLGGC